MKTVVYQVPVEPVERKEGTHTTTDTANVLQKINNQAYHLANRAITLFLNYLYPQPGEELLALKEARQPINQLEEQIKAIYKNQPMAQGNEQAQALLVQKKLARETWEDRVADCIFYKDVKEIIKTEFPDFPEILRKRLLRKVTLDWLYSWMNQRAGDRFVASFPFYRYGTHLPLCYDDNEKIRWKKNAIRPGQVQQFTLHWLDNIRLQTTFDGLDKRLPKLIEFLYFQKDNADSRNRKPHDTLKPTLKLAGTKWSIHIPVLENVLPLPSEQEEPLHIVFGFHHPICYAFGINHARPLGIDNGRYVLQQMLEFDMRLKKTEAGKSIEENCKQEKIGKIIAARSAYIKSLQTKALKAIIDLARKGQKNRIIIEQWPVTTQENQPTPDDFKGSSLPLLYDRLLYRIKQWDFNIFYNQLEQEAGKYGIQLQFFKPQWDFLRLYTSELTYTEKNRLTGKEVKRKSNLNFRQRIPTKYYSSGNLPEGNEKLNGYMIFKFNRKYNDTNAQLTLYSSPDHGKRKTEDFVYRIHIDINMAMNAAIHFSVTKSA